VKRFFRLATLATLCVSCVNVNVYVTFPEEKIRRAADELEGGLTVPPSGPQSFLPTFRAGVAYAQEIRKTVPVDFSTDSPVIQEAMAKRRGWVAELQEYKTAGYLGEALSFQVEVRSLPEDAKLAEKVRQRAAAENTERNIIIAELMRINKVNPQQEKEVRRIFADKRIEEARPGEWVQQQDGSWTKKQ